MRCHETDLALNRSVHRLDQVSWSLAPEDGVSSAIDRYIRLRKSQRLAGTPSLWLGGGNQTFAYHGLDKALKQPVSMETGA
jgi:hypothetical protein